jgi:transcriptional regulator of arginine metabolism
MVAATDRHARQDLVRELLATQVLRSQAELARALADRGVPCTQATVSRDLDAVGAVKVRGADGRLAYRLRADVATDPSGRVVASLRQFVTGITSSGNLVVLRTPPACAQPVASAIDHGGVAGVVATVAGDDTVLVVADEATRGAELADRLRATMAGSA